MGKFLGRKIDVDLYLANQADKIRPETVTKIQPMTMSTFR